MAERTDTMLLMERSQRIEKLERMLLAAIEEVISHNEDYHHVTRPLLMTEFYQERNRILATDWYREKLRANA